MAEGNRRRKAIQMLVLCAAFWGVSFATMKALTMAQQQLVPDAGSWFFTALSVAVRFGVSGLLMALVALPTLRHLTRLELEQGSWLAIFGVTGILFQMDGLAHTAASTSAFLTQCYVLIIPLWVALAGRRAPSLRVTLCCGLLVAGVAVLSDVDWRQFRLGRGELETIIASVMFAAQILWLERPRYRANNVNHFSTVMFLVMGLAAAGLAMITSPRPGAWFDALHSGPVAGMIAILVSASTLGGYVLMNYWQPKVTATEAGLVYSSEPIFASTMALFLPGWFSRWSGIDYPNEVVTSGLLLGGGLIIGANVLFQFTSRADQSR